MTAAEVLTGTTVVGACVKEASEVASVVEIALSVLASVDADALVATLTIEEARVLSVLSVLADALAESVVARIAVDETLAEGLKLMAVEEAAAEIGTPEDEVKPKLVDPEKGTDVEISVAEDAVLLAAEEVMSVAEALMPEEVVTEESEVAEALKEVLSVAEADEEPVADATSDVMLPLAVSLALAEGVREPDAESVAEADSEVRDPEEVAESVVKDASVAEAESVVRDAESVAEAEPEVKEAESVAAAESEANDAETDESTDERDAEMED